jgi:chemotaxis protein histidine kinase CheA
LAFALVSVKGRSFGRKGNSIQKLKDPSDDDDWDRPWDSGSADSSVAAIQMHHHEEVSQQRISPELEPKSNKKFFKKDYPSDTRPGVDVLHFKHPYPVVQDSGEFDDDYVKDENTDNGHWKAQQEYDRLRHKLKKEKKEAENALAKRTKQEQELKEAMDKYNKNVKHNKDKAAAAQKKAEEEKKSTDAAKKEKEEPKEESKSKGSSWSWNWWPFSWPKWDAPEDKPAPKKEVHQEQSGVDAATDDTEKAMDNLENCKKELETARKQLKDLMDELEKAKGHMLAGGLEQQYKILS